VNDKLGGNEMEGQVSRKVGVINADNILVENSEAKTQPEISRHRWVKGKFFPVFN
jgi:hypothetical protein